MSEYVQVGILLITTPNLIVVGTMIVAFAAGLLVKLPGHTRRQQG